MKTNNAITRITKADHTLIQELDDEAVLLNLDNNQYYCLDADSLRMFDVLITSANLGEAHAVLKGEYNVTGEKLWDDLTQFIDDLEKSGLIRVLNE